jgi:hypothetical protein
LSQPLPLHRFIICDFRTSLREFSTHLWTASRDKNLQPQTGNISLWISFAWSPSGHKKTHTRTLLFGITFLKHGRHFDYWNQSLNMRMRVCFPHFFI